MLLLTLVLPGLANRLAQQVAARLARVQQYRLQPGVLGQVAGIAGADDHAEALVAHAVEDLLGVLGGAVGVVGEFDAVEQAEQLDVGFLPLVGEQQDPRGNAPCGEHGLDQVGLFHLQRQHRNGQGVLQVEGVGPRADEDVHLLPFNQVACSLDRIVEDVVDDGDAGQSLELWD
ncbi:hypothetical protein D3C84_813270 [compost metagenome]